MGERSKKMRGKGKWKWNVGGGGERGEAKEKEGETIGEGDKGLEKSCIRSKEVRSKKVGR